MYFFSLIFLGIPFNIITFLLGYINSGKFDFKILNQNLIVMFSMFAFLVVLTILIIYIVYIYKLIVSKKNILKTKEYFRDVPNTYSPAIASAIIDLDNEITTDYPAVILYLCNIKYLKMERHNENTIIHSNNKDISRLKSHEKYVYECVLKNKKFKNDEFSKLVIADAKELGLIKEKEIKIHFFRKLGIVIIGLIIMMPLMDIEKSKLIDLIYNVVTSILYISLPVVIARTIYLLRKKQIGCYTRTEKGRIDAKKWIELKNYLNDYTLLFEKNMDYIVLAETYLPYLISFGKAKAVEEYVCENEKYRQILYKFNNN